MTRSHTLSIKAPGNTHAKLIDGFHTDQPDTHTHTSTCIEKQMSLKTMKITATRDREVTCRPYLVDQGADLGRRLVGAGADQLRAHVLETRGTRLQVVVHLWVGEGWEWVRVWVWEGQDLKI